MIQNLLLEWAVKAQLWSLLHAESSRRYQKWARLLGMPIVLLNTFTTSSLFANLLVDDQRLILVTALIQFLGTLLGALNQFLKLGTLALEHEKASTAAANIAEEISYQLALPAEERMEEPLLVAKVRTVLQNVRDRPPISESVLQKYGKLFDLQTVIPVPAAAAAASPSLEFFERLENHVNRDRISEFHATQLERLNTLLAGRRQQPT